MSITSPARPRCRGHARAAAAVATALFVSLAAATPGAGQNTAGSDDLTAAETFYLKAHGPIRYVMPLELPPTVFTDDQGQVKGITIDLLQLMSVRVGFDFDVVRPDNFTHALDLVRSGQADLIGPFTPSADREADFDFSPPFIRGSLGYWVAADGPAYESPDDLAGRRVAVIGGATSSGWIQQNGPDVDTVEAADTLAGLRLVADGDADAFFGSFSLAAYYVASGAADGLRPLGDQIVFADGAWAVADGNTILLSIINKGMDAVGQDDLTAIYVKWTGHDLGLPGPGPVAPFYENQWFQLAIGTALAVTAGLGVWTWSLRRRVHRRTRELAESSEYMTQLIEYSPAGIVSVGPDRRILNANPAFERMLGYEPGTLEGAHLVELTHPGDRGATAVLLDDEIHGRADTVDVQRRYRHRDGSPVWTRVRAVVVRGPDGSFAHTVSLVEDLTETRRVEETRRRTAEQELENRRLRELDEFKTQFFNAVAHELNTPLTPIQLQLHLLRTGRLGALTETQGKAAMIIDRNLARVATLVSDMLDVARLQNGRIRLRRERFDVSRTAHEAVETFEAAAADKGIFLEARIEDDLEIDGDPDRIMQVLLNLLSNAVKYTDRGGVALYALRHLGRVRVEVSDTGPGLTERQMEKLFQPFTQVPRAGAKTPEGTGLGLYISRELVTLHDGTIWCESRGSGQGSVFVFELPAASTVRRPDDERPTEPEHAPAERPHLPTARTR